MFNFDQSAYRKLEMCTFEYIAIRNHMAYYLFSFFDEIFHNIILF